MKKKDRAAGIHAESESYKEALLEKIRQMAEHCDDKDRLREEMESAPSGSVVEDIWRERLDEVTLAEMRGCVATMSFEEVFSARHSGQIRFGLKKTGEFLTERIVEMYDSSTCKSSFEAYRLYVDSSIFTVGDLTYIFRDRSLELAEAESSGFPRFIDVMRAYLVEKNKYEWKPISPKDKMIPQEIRKIWKKNLEKLYHEHAMVYAPLCVSSMKAKRNMYRLDRLLVDGQGYQVWKRRYDELLNEEAEREVSLCDSEEIAQRKYSEADSAGALRAKEIWRRRCCELAEISVQEIFDFEEMRDSCRFPCKENPAYEAYLIRYMELSITCSTVSRFDARTIIEMICAGLRWVLRIS
jgi:hypothetical protein